MVFRILSKPFINAIKVTAQGSTVVLLSTGLSCVLAVVIESSAHKLQYKLFPHWYKDVKYALGLPHLQYRDDQSQHFEDEEENVTTTQWRWSTTGAILNPPKEKYFDDERMAGYRPMGHESVKMIEQGKYEDVEIKQEVPILHENKLFESYHTRLPTSRADLFSPERVSKMVHTTAMTM